MKCHTTKNITDSFPDGQKAGHSRHPAGLLDFFVGFLDILELLLGCFLDVGAEGGDLVRVVLHRHTAIGGTDFIVGGRQPGNRQEVL